MRIQFKRLSYKNLLSCGNHPVEIDFTKSRSTLISGSNGSGKSTIIEGIIFGLYGKPYRKINKGQLLNSVNKSNLVVELEFSIGPSDYKIIRGIKPNNFELYHNGKLLDSNAAVRDMQKYLEDNILRLSYKSFTQIVILGSATYIPFMELTPASRREVIEDLLDIKVFSAMNVLVKKRISENKELIKELKSRLELLNTEYASLKKQKELVENHKQKELDSLQEQIQEQNDNLVKIQEDLNNLEIPEVDKSVSDKLKKAISKSESMLVNLRSNHRKSQKRIDFYKNNKICPTCFTEMNDEHRTKHIQDHIQKESKYAKAIQELELKCINFDKMQSKLSDQLKKRETSIQRQNTLKSKCDVIISNIKDLQNKYDKKKREEIDTTYNISIQEKKEVISKNKQNIQSETDDYELNRAVATILKDDGVKSVILKEYIPIVNRLINSYLNEFELFVDFHLDETFNEVIKSRYRDDFSYASFSEGEKLRISLSIMLAWRTISKMRNSLSTNILILDETLDGSLDVSGIEHLIDTLHRLHEHDNVFVISHRGQSFEEKFDTHMMFKKEGNFSSVEFFG